MQFNSINKSVLLAFAVITSFGGQGAHAQGLTAEPTQPDKVWCQVSELGKGGKLPAGSEHSLKAHPGYWYLHTRSVNGLTVRGPDMGHVTYGVTCKVTQAQGAAGKEEVLLEVTIQDYLGELPYKNVSSEEDLPKQQIPQVEKVYTFNLKDWRGQKPMNFKVRGTDFVVALSPSLPLAVE